MTRRPGRPRATPSEAGPWSTTPATTTPKGTQHTVASERPGTALALRTADPHDAGGSAVRVSWPRYRGGSMTPDRLLDGVPLLRGLSASALHALGSGSRIVEVRAG